MYQKFLIKFLKEIWLLVQKSFESFMLEYGDYLLIYSIQTLFILQNKISFI